MSRGDILCRYHGWVTLLTFRARRFRRNSSHVLVITAEGLFQAYAIDLQQGGECALVREYP